MLTRVEAARCHDMVASPRPFLLPAMTARNGCARALVVGDVFRRLVARALAQHLAGALEAACMPYQSGLRTSAGTEVAAATPRATVLSVDAVGAPDHVSRQAMLDGLRSRPLLASLLPYVFQFYGKREQLHRARGFASRGRRARRRPHACTMRSRPACRTRCHCGSSAAG